MNPTVLAAAIGVGGTVIVGLAGFWASVRNTSTTAALAREGRIWKRRAKAYVDAISALQSLLRITTPTGFAGFGIFPTSGANDVGATDWEDLDTRLQAWASESVLTAMRTAREYALPLLFGVADAASLPPPPADQEPVSPDSGQRHAAVGDVAALIELMRSELQGRESRSPVDRWRPPYRKSRAWRA